MQFSIALVAAVACAVANAVKITNGPASFVGITAGKALNISWAEASGPVTLTLKTGEANVLTTVSTIASGLTGTSYAWAIPATLPESFYALEIGDSTAIPNYSVRFEITGGPAASSSASGSVTSTSSSPSATASSNSTITSSSRSASGTGSTTSSGSASRTATTTSGTSTASAPPNTNSGASFASPLAFVLLAFAALMTLN